MEFGQKQKKQWLAEQGFKGDGPVPKVDSAIIGAMEKAYVVPYIMITERNLPPTGSSPSEVSEAAYQCVKTLIRG